MSRLAFGLALLAAACGGAPEPDPSSTGGGVPQATPVSVAAVERATLTETITAPGSTAMLVEQQVRAPFAGVLTALGVVEGDRVARGQQIGELVARDSEAALRGAEEMLRSASNESERADAERALELARSHRVEAPLLAAASGIVTRRAASAGDRVGEDQELLTIAAADSLVFRADVAQSDLARIRPGMAVEIDLAGAGPPLSGTTRGLLAGADAGDLTAPLRVDFNGRLAVQSAGLFGTARIAVARHADAVVVPAAAVLRDDVRGTSRVGTVAADGTLHWVAVETGLHDGDRLEIVSPRLEPGTRVVLSGQVGLAEGTPLAIQP